MILRPARFSAPHLLLSLPSLLTYFTFETWLATHCHFPLGIFTQVSVQRFLMSLVPDLSVSLPLLPRVAMAALP